MIRKIFGAVYLVYGLLMFIVTMLVVIIPIWIISLLPEPYRARAIHPVFRLWMGVFMLLIFCPVVRRGKKYFAKGQNYVVVINHNSYMDIPVSSPWIPGPNKTLGKIEMTKVPLFGLIYKAGAIIIDRKNQDSRRESFSKMQDTLSKGIHLCLYPEGTRNKTDKPLQPFYDGAFITAIKTQTPIIPGILLNTKKVLCQKNILLTRPSVIYFHFLEPIPTKGLTLEDLSSLKSKVHDLMESYYVNNKNKFA